MKKILVISAVILFAVTSVFAVPFSPTLLKLNASPQITYKFDGSVLQIPVTLTGKPSNSIFMVYTKDQADAVGKVRNGLLGWHYVNKLDTCLYLSPSLKMVTGSNSVTWDGKDNYGTKVPAGAYTYYLWGFDNQNPKELAQKNMDIESNYYNCTEGRDIKGMPLANPFFYMSLRKWPVGIDPLTASASLESTTASRTGISRYGISIALDPKDHGYFWQCEKDANNTLFITKYKWNPNSAATVETKWADSGTYTWVTMGTGSLDRGPGVISDNKEILFSGYWNVYSSVPASQLLVLNIADGTQERVVDLSDWYCNKADADAGGQMNGGIHNMDFRNDHLFTHGRDSCMSVALNPYRDPGDEIIWVNGNGDHVHDLHDNLLNDAHPWMCNDYNVGPEMYSYSVDANEFAAFNASVFGAVTFGLFGPSGTGIGYFVASGETSSQKWASRYLDEDTAYDGFYMDNDSATIQSGQSHLRTGSWFIGHDSIKGIISTGVGVNEAAPSAFLVAQNSPNPFNPTTSINFTLAKAGKVTVDIYNAAGQKIDTVVNTTMNAGNHSATWNASRFSAGVYFYTVNSGGISKTMKMTLLK